MRSVYKTGVSRSLTSYFHLPHLSNFSHRRKVFRPPSQNSFFLHIDQCLCSLPAKSPSIAQLTYPPTPSILNSNTLSSRSSSQLNTSTFSSPNNSRVLVSPFRIPPIPTFQDRRVSLYLVPILPTLNTSRLKMHYRLLVPISPSDLSAPVSPLPLLVHQLLLLPLFRPLPPL